ncbi:hypothetical protein M5E06_28440 [Azospirillum sp. A1-3]|uniref:hypothetical protein n=1 Tax=Azospirillum sp. A1-3 TaxID=185874 RepID=UPI0020778234|nr:hypothetical protein [Azospirillum sp. A1-3]MCM8738055.1 hypothetical protein [Azospirillum sp. A1-3]
MNSYEELDKALSLERFACYLDMADGDRERVIELYSLNTALSEALWDLRKRYVNVLKLTGWLSLAALA